VRSLVILSAVGVTRATVLPNEGNRDLGRRTASRFDETSRSNGGWTLSKLAAGGSVILKKYAGRIDGRSSRHSGLEMLNGSANGSKSRSDGSRPSPVDASSETDDDQETEPGS
jgi:hypothetical protein